MLTSLCTVLSVSKKAPKRTSSPAMPAQRRGAGFQAAGQAPTWLRAGNVAQRVNAHTCKRWLSSGPASGGQFFAEPGTRLRFIFYRDAMLLHRARAQPHSPCPRPPWCVRRAPSARGWFARDVYAGAHQPIFISGRFL